MSDTIPKDGTDATDVAFFAAAVCAGHDPSALLASGSSITDVGSTPISPKSGHSSFKLPVSHQGPRHRPLQFNLAVYKVNKGTI